MDPRKSMGNYPLESEQLFLMLRIILGCAPALWYFSVDPCDNGIGISRAKVTVPFFWVSVIPLKDIRVSSLSNSTV